LYSHSQIKALEAALAEMDQDETEITLDNLRPGMVLARDVVGTRDGEDVVLVPEGYELSRTTIVFLRQAGRHGQIQDTFFIRKMSLTPPEGNDTA
jgi:hypothetical protein